jgi:hypothetical protein
MGRVGIYRLATAVFALSFAIWAILGKPRWPGLLALSVSFVAIFEALIVM